MDQGFTTQPLPPMDEKPKGNKTVIIVSVIALSLLCCCCLVLFAGYFTYENYDYWGDPFGIYGLIPALKNFLLA